MTTTAGSSNGGSGSADHQLRQETTMAAAAATAAATPSSATTTTVEEAEKRVKDETERRDTLQAKVKNRLAELESLIGSVPTRPREKMSELNDKIVELEKKRTINSIELQEERKILWEIQRVEKIKRQVEAYESHDRLIKDQKAQIAELKEALKAARADVDAARTELSVLRTAGRVGCAVEELVGTEVECPPDKIGNVIGRKGSNVKQLQEKASVTVNVTKKGGGDGGKVRVMGAPDSVDAAAGQVGKVISAVDEELDVSERRAAYLTAKDITALADLRSRHPDVRVAVQRGAHTVPMRGCPDDIEKVRDDLLGMDLVTREIDLPAAEASNVVGKQGATVHKIQVDHQVTVDVERKGGDGGVGVGGTSHVTVVGLEADVEAALGEIESLAAEARRTTRTVEIDPNVRTFLLQESGKCIKEIHRKAAKKVAGSQLNVSVSSDAVVVTGQARHVALAFDVVEEEVGQLNSSIVKLDCDPVVVPVIIGKGGETIKKLRGGRDVCIEVSKAGHVALCGSNKEQVAEVEKSIRAIVDAHRVARVNIDASFYKSQAEDLRRSKSKAITALCHYICDDERCDIVLRGEEDKVKEAEAVVRDFLETNFKEEVSVSGDDMRALLLSGKDCKMQQLSEEYDVKLHSNRERGLIEAKGKHENVQEAVKAIHRYLFGGDGFTVERLALNEELLGMVIGKGGKKKAALQKKYDSVSIAVNGKEGIISLRGPEKQVEECKAEIAKYVAAAKVSGTIKLSKSEHDKLSKAHAARDVVHGIPVHLSITDDAVTVKGYSSDVKDAVSLLTEAIHGKYESRLGLPSQQFRKVRDTCSRNSSHLDRITKLTGASVIVDSSDEAIVLRGKRGQVKAAKLELTKFLEFILSSTFSKLDVPSSLVRTVADVPVLAETSSSTGASLLLDRDTNSLLIFSTDSSHVTEAVAAMKGKIEEARKLCFEIQLEPTEDWVVASVIGKRGAHINSLRKSTKCHIEVDSFEHRVTITADDQDTLARGRATIEEHIDKARRECAAVKIPARDLPAFIGRGGKGISDFAETHDVDVQAMKNNSGIVRITGDETKVAAAKIALNEWMKIREDTRKQSHAFEVLEVRKYEIRRLLSNKGAKIRAVQEEFKCRIDIDREKSLVSIRAGTDEKRKGAIAMIRTILEDEQNVSDSGEGTSSDEKHPTKPRRSGGKKDGSEVASDGDTKKPHQQEEPLVEDADHFPALAGQSQKEEGTKDISTSAKESAGRWASPFASTQIHSTNGHRDEHDEYMALVAQGSDDAAVQKSIATS